MTTIQTTARNATLEQLAEILTRQQEAKIDAVVPAQAITSHDGVLSIAGMGMDGDTGTFLPSQGMDGDIAEALSVPVKYLRRMRAERLDLYDATVNGWLQGGIDPDAPSFAPDGRSFLVRGFLDGEGGPGFGRALLSDSYRRIENLDVVLGSLQAIREAGIHAQVVGADLTETRMKIRLVCPEIAMHASKLLENYHNPFEGVDVGRWRGVARRENAAFAEGTEPIVFAGLDLSNSETGGGANIIVPVIGVKVCMNGLVLKGEMMREVHLGGKQEEGVIRWSHQTERLNMELIQSRTVDAVQAFLSYDFLASQVEKLEEKAVKRLENPGEVVELVGSAMKFSEQETALLLDLLIKGQQITAGGVMQAVSAMGQAIEEADRAYDVERMAIDALEVAFAAA